MQDFSRHPRLLRRARVVSRRSTTTRAERASNWATTTPARGDDKFKLRAFGDARLPIETAYADVYLWKNAADGKYFITMVNRLNPQDPNSPAHLEIKLLYGGAVHDQRYIVSVPPGLGDRQGWYTVLRYNMTGRDNRLNRERRVWHDYKFYMWWSAGADGRYGTPDDVLTAPPVNTNAVQTMCAGCHLTGWERYQDKATGQFLVRAVNDPGGDMNIDDDPELDEINVGCESCHGPGSEHVANGGRSRFIVNPRYLSAERSSVVCGRCHDRRQGYGGPTNRLHAGDQRDRRAGQARHQPPRADYEVHRPDQEGADDARARAGGQHLARRRPLEQAASAVCGFPEVEDVQERSIAGRLLGLPRHAWRHAVPAVCSFTTPTTLPPRCASDVMRWTCCRTWKRS